jgi:hypothetical protein
MAYLKEMIQRLGKALGIKPTSSRGSAGAASAQRVEAVEGPVAQPPAVEARSSEASGAPAIVGE